MKFGPSSSRNAISTILGVTLLTVLVATTLMWDSSALRSSERNEAVPVSYGSSPDIAATPRKIVRSIFLVGILYDQPKYAEVVKGANWISVILSDPLEQTTYKHFVENMHSAGFTVAGTINRKTYSSSSNLTS